MSNDRVEELLEELLNSGGTPEEVCSSCPELAAEVRAGWQRLRALEAEVGAMFPEPTPNETASATGVKRGLAPTPALPQIRGYEVRELLGHGGMAVVYKAWHLRLNRPVALKMLLAGAYARPDELERFLREADAVASLRHPNIVQVYDAGDVDGQPYFTMEFVEGGSLAEKMTGTPQPAREAAALVATIAEAIHAAHQSGIVHRDLKPSNILLTADGTPKISDFGLARRLDDGIGLTLSGAPLGTPSYMAPEQALGRTSAIGPATDVYSLGATLYELLTGRPPFRAETATATHQQVIHQEPVSPSRLNARVPRDLETICLKCLHKAPAGRYATAAALAEDLHRFGRGESIVARPAGFVERSRKWVRRHPTGAAMLAVSFLLTVVLVAASFWLVVQRTNQRHAVEADLRDVAELQNSTRWGEAQAALERAEARLGWAEPEDLRRRITQARRDLDLVVQIDAIRLKRATRGLLTLYKVPANRDYAETFQNAGLGTYQDPPAQVATAVRASAVRWALVAALYDWANCCADRDQRTWLLEVARQADPDPEGWHERILDAKVWDDPEALTQLAQSVPVEGRSVSLLLTLGDRLTAAHRDPTPLLKRVQKEHPGDFWANLLLGNALFMSNPKQAEGYYRAALAVRPRAPVAYCGVGDALKNQKELEEAAGYYRKALQLDAGYARAHSNLGQVLQDQGRLEEAIRCYRQAIQHDSRYAWAHLNLALALRDNGLLSEAYEHGQEAARLDPSIAQVRACLASILLRQHRTPEAVTAWHDAVTANPDDHESWCGYAELSLFLGHAEEYHRICLAMLDRFGNTQSQFSAEPVGRACLLLPGTDDEVRRAVALIDRAVAAKASTPEWIYRYILFAKGLSDYRRGRWSGAISVMQGKASAALRPAPQLIVAMAQHKLGQKPQARKSLARAVLAYDWSPARADDRSSWIRHILRREAEALILPKLPEFLAGTYQPRDADERLAFSAVCQFQGRHAAAARLYAAAFMANPRLADDRSIKARYYAARAAAQAGCGRGTDAAKVEPMEQARWRKQARDLLRAELAAWVRVLDRNTAAARGDVRQALAPWRHDPELACVRDARELEQLDVDERKDFLALWAEVNAVLARTVPSGKENEHGSQ